MSITANALDGWAPDTWSTTSATVDQAAGQYRLVAIGTGATAKVQREFTALPNQEHRFQYNLSLLNGGSTTVRVEQKVNGVYQYLATQQTQTSSGTYELSFVPQWEDIRISVSGTSRYALNNLYLDRDQIDTLISTYALSRGYRYGFNGMEKDDEVKGRGNSYDFGARMYDSRLGRFLSIDPKTRLFPYWSPYLFAANNPVRMIDVNGEGPGDRVRKAKSMVGTPYKQETTSSLRTGTTKEALEFMDCAEFVCRVLAEDMITTKIEHMTSSGLKNFLDNKERFVHSQIPQVGDVAVWDGHVGIVTSVDKDGKIKLTHARGEGKLALENPYHILPQQYRNSTFHGYYRPIDENDNSQNNTTITRTLPTTLQQTENGPIYASRALLEEVIIVGQRTINDDESLGNESSGGTIETNE